MNVDEFIPRPRDEALAALLEECRADPPNPGNRQERFPDEDNARRLAEFLAGDAPTVLYFGKLLYNKGVHVLLEAMRGIDARTLVVGFGDYRHELERIAPPRTLFTGPLEHRHLVQLIPLADVGRRALDLPRGVRDGRGRGGGGRVPAARRAALGPRGGGGGARGGRTRTELRHLTSFATGDSLDLADEAPRAARAPGGHAPGARRGRARRVAVEKWSWAGVAAGRSSPSNRLLTSMGEAQKLPYDELIRRPREAFDAGTDSHGRGRGGVRAARLPRRSRSSTVSRRSRSLRPGRRSTSTSSAS